MRKIKFDLERLRAAVPEEWKPRLVLAENVLIIGPFLLFWLAGLLRYQPGELKFRQAFQSMLIFLAYLVLLALNQLFYAVGFYGFHVSMIFSSLFALFYLLATGLQVLRFWQKREFVLKNSNTLLDKLSLN